MFNDIMSNVYLDLTMWECQIVDIVYDYNENIISITFKDKDDTIMCLITKKENNKFLLRADVIEDFDRWSNATFEEEYDWNNFYSDCYNPITLYKKLLLTYYNIYKNLE